MSTKRHINEDAERARETYRCAQCGRFIAHDIDGYFDREDRADESSSVIVFCNEAHADRYHARKPVCAETSG